MMNSIRRVEIVSAKRLQVTFADGFTGEIDLKPFLTKGLALEIAQPDRFMEVSTEPGGGIAWPNGFDICPEFLRELAEKRHAAA